MKALIIAAGRGSRLENFTRGIPKPLTRLLGLSLIERIILTVKQAGIREFVITVGYQGEKIKKHLGDGSRFGIKIRYVENEKWDEGNGLSVLKARKLINENFILLMSDHIFDGRILKEFVNYDFTSTLVLAVDKVEPSPEDTKVFERDGKILKIGKDIQESNYVDTGIFLCSPSIFSSIEGAVKKGETEISDCIKKIVVEGEVEVFDISQINSYQSKMRKEIKPWWIDIDREEDLIRARKLIIESASKNPSDLLAHYLHKPIENALVAVISNFSITPNQLTFLVNVLAYTATVLFFLGYLLPASVLTFIVGIVDGLDGKLARVKLLTSKLGSLEHSFDLLFEFSWFIALSYYLYNSLDSAVPLFLCIFIILFIAFYRHVYDQFRRAMGMSLDDAGEFERRFKRVAGRRNLYNIPILVGVLLAAPLYSLVFILIHSGITAIIYSARAVKHLRLLDRSLHS
jgi:CDP-L-myo-inositol myo-inositolphosphotransferase